MLFPIIAFVLALAPLVFFHELGHYLVARWCDVHVESFSIGFGPALWERKDKKGTTWRIGLLPLGGYVKMLGDADPSSTLPSKDTEAYMSSHAFHRKKPYQKIAVSLAGPLANYLLSFVVFLILFVAIGKPALQPIVGPVASDARISGYLVEGDRIRSIQGIEVKDFSAIMGVLQETPSNVPLNFVVERSGARQEVVLPKETHSLGVWLGKLGLTANPKEKFWEKLGFSSAIKGTLGTLYTLSIAPFRALFGGQLGALGGPLGIAKDAGDFLQQGVGMFLWFVGALSVGLGVFNLLPLPILDGGGVLLAIIEWVKGSPPRDKILEYVQLASLILLGGLFVTLTVKDLGRFEFIQKLFRK